MTLALGTLVILVAIYAIVRRLDVRMVLLVAALLLGALAHKPMAIVIEFFTTFANERFVVPICTAMGFAYVLRHTGCDQHLVHLLVNPLKRVRWLLIPGTVVVGFIVNIPIISQTSTAATLGPVVIPILMAAGISSVTIGATLVLGSSIGGELLNPGAPELRTVVEEGQKALREAGQTFQPFTERDCVEQLLPLNVLGLIGATGLFWWQSVRVEAHVTKEPPPPAAPTTAPLENEPAFQVNFVKAAIPFLPLLLLLLTGPPLEIFQVPVPWLLRESQASDTGLYNSRLIGLAMLVGVVVAAAAAPARGLTATCEFFNGAGYGFANIISLIVAANCFGLAVKEIGLAALIGDLIAAVPALLLPMAGSLPLAFALLCGSGMASTQSLFGFFAGPAVEQGVDPALVGAVVALASAAGRTMSPVAAVMLLCATLTDTSPFDLFRRVAVPLVFGIFLVVVAAMILVAMGGY